jgi:uncharacterized membrane protein YdbT with pleckstrin-like domain
MYCNKCSADNPDDAVYCKKCGSLLEPEAETHVAPRRGTSRLESVGEERIFSISPTLKFIYLGYVIAVVAAFILVALLTLFVSGFIPVVGVVTGVGMLLIPAYYHLRQKLVRYSLTEATIEIDRGMISRTTQNIPLRRVQDVTVSATLLQRLLGYGDIMIDNASEDGGKVVLDNVDTPRKYADQILRRMRDLEG